MCGKTEETGEGEKSPTNSYEISCVAKNGQTQIISKNGDNQSIKTISCKPLCSLKDGEGNIIAQDYIDFIRQKIHRECGYAVLNGQIGGWEFSGATNVQAVYCINLIKDCDLSEDTINVTSNFLNSETYKNRYSKTNIISMKENSIVLTFDLNTFSTIEDFKSFLANNNLIVVYKLANAVEEDLNSTCELIQYADQTTIYNSDNAELEVELTNNKAISSTNESISELQNKVQNIKVAELWKNSNPSQSFSAQNITLNDRRDNYDYIEVEWRIFYSVVDRDMITKSTAINGMPSYSNEGGKIYRRLYLASNDNTMQFTDCTCYNTYGGTTVVNNEFLIPTKVVGYKIN